MGVKNDTHVRAWVVDTGVQNDARVTGRDTARGHGRHFRRLMSQWVAGIDHDLRDPSTFVDPFNP